jgi:hypothetical protein
MNSILDFGTTATRGTNSCDLIVINVVGVNGWPLIRTISHGLVKKFWKALGESQDVISWKKVKVCLIIG